MKDLLLNTLLVLETIALLHFLLPFCGEFWTSLAIAAFVSITETCFILFGLRVIKGITVDD